MEPKPALLLVERLSLPPSPSTQMRRVTQPGHPLLAGPITYSKRLGTYSVPSSLAFSLVKANIALLPPSAIPLQAGLCAIVYHAELSYDLQSFLLFGAVNGLPGEVGVE
jgi:hypothetical protein